MPTVDRSALVPYSAGTMFGLVNDVVKYPEFLPDCVDAKIVEQSDSHMQAALLISKAGVKQWFTTRNELVPDQQIKICLVSGPFQQLQGGWHFTALDEAACKVTLALQFEFSSGLVDLAFGKVFSNIANNMVKAFTERARALHNAR